MRIYILALIGLVALGCSSGSSGGSGNGEFGSSVSTLQQLAEAYPTESPQTVKGLLDQLTVEDHWTMELVQLGPAFKLAVFLDACNFDSSITWHSLSDGTAYDCWSGQAEWNESQQLIDSLGLGGSFADNVESGRMEVLIYEKCRSGEIDEGSCSMYYGVQDQIAANTAQTNELIIDNTGNQCRVGRDPGCYP